MRAEPAVTVVIPTRSRPELVVRAVHSALAQTLSSIEVVVVLDGPDEATRTRLGELADPRLRVVEQPQRSGAPAARNRGVLEARGRWTALLDDDDEWLPGKLARQLELGESSAIPDPIVITRLIHRTPRADLLLPRRLPDPGEPLSEYFAVRRGLFHGEGFVQTSTILAPTRLLREVPFATDLRRLQELDWSLRALARPGVDLVVAPEPLVIWHADENRPRVSFDAPWRDSLAWLRRTRPLVTPRAYAALALSVISAMAAPTRDRRALRILLGEARRNGRPNLLDYLTFAQIWLLPADLRRNLRDRILCRAVTMPAQRAASNSTPTAAIRPTVAAPPDPSPEVAA